MDAALAPTRHGVDQGPSARPLRQAPLEPLRWNRVGPPQNRWSAVMHEVAIVGAVLIGILVGWIAEQALGREHGLSTNPVVGVVGAFLGP